MGQQEKLVRESTEETEAPSKSKKKEKPKKDKATEMEKEARPRQEQLPGISLPLADLEGLAIEYNDLKSDRQRIRSKEVLVKQQLVASMKKHKRENYIHGQVEIRLVAEKEIVKVKVKAKADAE
jgi:hypothetical protein